MQLSTSFFSAFICRTKAEKSTAVHNIATQIKLRKEVYFKLTLSFAIRLRFNGLLE